MQSGADRNRGTECNNESRLAGPHRITVLHDELPDADPAVVPYWLNPAMTDIPTARHDSIPVPDSYNSNANKYNSVSSRFHSGFFRSTFVCNLLMNLKLKLRLPGDHPGFTGAFPEKGTRF